MRMHTSTKERYERNMRLSIVAIENVLLELKKEKRVSIKHFKHIIDICKRQLENGGGETN